MQATLSILFLHPFFSRNFTYKNTTRLHHYINKNSAVYKDLLQAMKKPLLNNKISGWPYPQQSKERQNEIIDVCILKFKAALQLYQLNVCSICDDMP